MGVNHISLIFVRINFSSDKVAESFKWITLSTYQIQSLVVRKQLVGRHSCPPVVIINSKLRLCCQIANNVTFDEAALFSKASSYRTVIVAIYFIITNTYRKQLIELTFMYEFILDFYIRLVCWLYFVMNLDCFPIKTLLVVIENTLRISLETKICKRSHVSCVWAYKLPISIKVERSYLIRSEHNNILHNVAPIRTNRLESKKKLTIFYEIEQAICTFYLIQILERMSLIVVICRTESAISVDGWIANNWIRNLCIRAIKQSERTSYEERKCKHILFLHPVYCLRNVSLHRILKTYFMRTIRSTFYRKAGVWSLRIIASRSVTSCLDKLSVNIIIGIIRNTVIIII